MQCTVGFANETSEQLILSKVPSAFTVEKTEEAHQRDVYDETEIACTRRAKIFVHSQVLKQNAITISAKDSFIKANVGGFVGHKSQKSQ